MGSYRDHDSRYASGDYDSGRRSTLRSYGDRRLEAVKGNVYSAVQMHVTSESPRRPSPDPPSDLVPASRYPVPASRSSRTGGKGEERGAIWSFNDPEMKRRRRVAKYKAYAVEGKMKASLRKSWRWVKSKCSKLVHGF